MEPTTDRQVLDRLVEKLQQEHDVLAGKRRALEEEIGRKRVQLSSVTDMIAAEGLRLSETRERVESVIRAEEAALQHALLQTRAKSADVVTECRKVEHAANVRKENILKSESELLARAAEAEKRCQASEAKVASVLAKMNEIRAAVAAWQS